MDEVPNDSQDSVISNRPLEPSPQSLTLQNVEALVQKKLEEERRWLDFAQSQAAKDREYFREQINFATLFASIIVGFALALAVGSHYFSVDKALEESRRKLDSQIKDMREEFDFQKERLRSEVGIQVQSTVEDARLEAKLALQDQLERPALRTMMEEAVLDKAKGELEIFTAKLNALNIQLKPTLLYLSAISGDRKSYLELLNLSKRSSQQGAEAKGLIEAIKGNFWGFGARVLEAGFSPYISPELRSKFTVSTNGDPNDLKSLIGRIERIPNGSERLAVLSMTRDGNTLGLSGAERESLFAYFAEKDPDLGTAASAWYYLSSFYKGKTDNGFPLDKRKFLDFEYFREWLRDESQRGELKVY